MSHRSKIIKEWVDVSVTAPNQIFKEKFEVEKHASKIIGIAITSDFEDKLYHRGSQRIVIAEKEIYPEDYETKMLMQGLNVPVNERFINMGEEIDSGNHKVEIDYKDTDHPYASFTPYKVRLYVFSRIEQ